MGFKPSVIDLFAGAGGLSLGFACAGFRVETAVDRHDAAVETLAGISAAMPKTKEV